MPAQTTQPLQIPALIEFKAIRDVLRVPFLQDLVDLLPPEFPRDRQWKGPCLGYHLPSDYPIGSPAQALKPRAEKKT